MNRFSTRVTDIGLVRQWFDLLPQPVGGFVRSNETVAGSSVEDGDETFRHALGLSDIGVNLIVPLRHDEDGFGIGYSFHTAPWTLEETDSFWVDACFIGGDGGSLE